MGRKELPFVLGSEWLQGGGEGGAAAGLEGGGKAAGGWEPGGGGEQVGVLPAPTWLPRALAKRTLPAGWKIREGLRSGQSGRALSGLIRGESGCCEIFLWDPHDPSHLLLSSLPLPPTSAARSCPTVANGLACASSKASRPVPGLHPQRDALPQVPAGRVSERLALGTPCPTAVALCPRRTLSPLPCLTTILVTT